MSKVIKHRESLISDWTKQSIQSEFCPIQVHVIRLWSLAFAT